MGGPASRQSAWGQPKGLGPCARLNRPSLECIPQAAAMSRRISGSRLMKSLKRRAACLSCRTRAWDKDRTPRASQSVPLVMPAGSAQILTGPACLARGENRIVDVPPTAVTIVLDASCARPARSAYPAMAPQRVVACPDGGLCPPEPRNNNMRCVGADG